MRFFRAPLVILVAVAAIFGSVALPAFAYTPPDPVVTLPPQSFVAADIIPAEDGTLGRDAFTSVVLDVVAWPVVDGGASITDCFHCRSGGAHNGQDFTPGGGTPITALARGVVVEVGVDGSYGNMVVVESVVQGQTVQALYAHMNAWPSVAQGQEVPVGTVLGYVGSTGNSTGNHLHLEISVSGALVDPYAWLTEHVNSYLWD